MRNVEKHKQQRYHPRPEMPPLTYRAVEMGSILATNAVEQAAEDVLLTRGLNC
jgi:hypothetical protein